MPEHPVVYVDLIEDQPIRLDEYKALHPGFSDDSYDAAYRSYRDNFQPWRWHSSSEGNHEVLGHGERYFNRADALSNIMNQFAESSHVFLREAEHGNVRLRMPYPNDLGEVIVLGPNLQVTADGRTINWNGVNYTRDPDVPVIGAAS